MSLPCRTLIHNLLHNSMPCPALHIDAQPFLLAGVTSDLAKVRETMDAEGHPALFLVDGVSSIGALDFQFDAWKVDVAVTGSQKALSLPTGLAVLQISDKVSTCLVYLLAFVYALDSPIFAKNGQFAYQAPLGVLSVLEAKWGIWLAASKQLHPHAGAGGEEVV